MRCASVWRRIFWVLIKTSKPELQETNRFIQKWMFILAHMPPCLSALNTALPALLVFCLFCFSSSVPSLLLLHYSLWLWSEHLSSPLQNLVKIRHLSRTEKRYRDEYRAQLTNNPEHKQEVCCWMFNKKTHSVYNKGYTTKQQEKQ